jgi:hypothetical protein
MKQEFENLLAEDNASIAEMTVESDEFHKAISHPGIYWLILNEPPQ